MVKLKRMNEAQLNLFSWKPKNDVPINAPKVPSIKEVPTENNTGSVEDTYNGKEDVDQSKWFTESFLNKKYKEFNSRFFNNDLPSNLPVKIVNSRGGKKAGECRLLMNPRTSEITPVEIRVMSKNFANRSVLENVLLHEMCHAYQAMFLCNGDLSVWKEDSRKGSGSSGHGPLFFKAADKVNKSLNNKEGYLVTQYASTDEIESKPMLKADGWFLFNPTSLFSVQACMIPNTSTGKSKIADYANLGSSQFFTYRDGSVKAKINDLFSRKIESFYLFSPNIRTVFSLISKGDLIYNGGTKYTDGSIREFCFNKDGKRSLRVLVIQYRDSDYFKSKILKYFSTSLGVGDIHVIEQNVEYRDYKINQPYTDLLFYLQPGLLSVGKSFDDAMNIYIEKGVYSISEWKSISIKEKRVVKLSRKSVNESEDSDLEIDFLIREIENIPNVEDVKEKGSFIYIDID